MLILIIFLYNFLVFYLYIKIIFFSFTPYSDIAAVSPSSSISSFEPTSVSPRSRSSTGGNFSEFYLKMQPIQISKNSSTTSPTSSLPGGGGGGVSVGMVGPSSGNNSAPPKKPPRRNLSVSPTHGNVQQQQTFNYNSPNHQHQQNLLNMHASKQPTVLRNPSNKDSKIYSKQICPEGGIEYDSSTTAMQKDTQQQASEQHHHRHHIGQRSPAASYNNVFLARTGDSTTGIVQRRNLTSSSSSKDFYMFKTKGVFRS